jgi:UDP-glucose:glycoprotein glucosyltransferase
MLIQPSETAAEENSTAYFPLLDRIADGYFDKAKSDRDLFISFVELLETDGHITDPETLSSFQLALSVRSAAPRIEAHYQFYNTSVEPSLEAEQTTECESWVTSDKKQYCSPQLEDSHGVVTNERFVVLL